MKHQLHKKLISKTEDKEVLAFTKSDFIDFVPQCLNIAVMYNLNEEETEWSDNMDCLEYHVRAFVCGKLNRMHRIYYEIRRFKVNLLNKECIILMLEEIKEKLTENEIYEYMPRFNIVRDKCMVLLNKINPHEVDIEALKKEYED